MCFGLDLVCSGRELVQVLDVYLSWVVPARIIPVPVLFVPVARWRFSIRMISTKDVSTRANALVSTLDCLQHFVLIGRQSQ